MRNSQGFALAVALMAMMIGGALIAALTLTTSAEVTIAANYRTAAEGMYAAETALDRAADELAFMGRWDDVLGGSVRSRFTDGDPATPRTLVDGSVVDLAATVNLANCGRVTACSAADMDAVTADRPDGVNNPRWQLFAYGRFRDLVPEAAVDLDFYLVVLVGDDGAETDANPALDGGPPIAPAVENPGRGVLAIRALAFGPSGTQKVIQSTIARAVRTLTWTEVR